MMASKAMENMNSDRFSEVNFMEIMENIPQKEGSYSGGVERDVRQKIRDLMEYAPSDASAIFVLRRKEEGFKALLKVRSRSGLFVAGGQNEELTELIDDVANQIWKQIRHWRETRGELV